MKSAYLRLWLVCILPLLGAAPQVQAAPPSTLRQRYGLRAPAALARARSALVLVDFQREFFPGGKLALPEAHTARARAQALLAWARANRLLVVHVTQVASSGSAPLFAPGSSGAEVVPQLAPQGGEPVMAKSAGGAFSQPALAPLLAERGIDTLILAGLMTHLAVDTTARDATLRGLHVVVAADATATRTLSAPNGGPPVGFRMLQRAALAALSDRFADVLSTRAILRLPIRD